MSAGQEVVADARSHTVGCVIDQDVPANTESVPDVIGSVGTVEVAGDGKVWLHVDGHPVVALEAGETTRQMQACMKRGYRYVGVVLVPGLVRVCNE